MLNLYHHFRYSVPTIKVLEQVKCKGREHTDKELDRVQNLGGEGLMIRKPGSKYDRGRSYSLLKIKTFYDADVRVMFFLLISYLFKKIDPPLKTIFPSTCISASIILSIL